MVEPALTTLHFSFNFSPLIGRQSLEFLGNQYRDKTRHQKIILQFVIVNNLNSIIVSVKKLICTQNCVCNTKIMKNLKLINDYSKLDSIPKNIQSSNRHSMLKFLSNYSKKS